MILRKPLLYLPVAILPERRPETGASTAPCLCLVQRPRHRSNEDSNDEEWKPLHCRKRPKKWGKTLNFFALKGQMFPS